MNSNSHRLFFGFEFSHDSVYVLAMDAAGEVVLRARFPLNIKNDNDLDSGSASCVAATLRSFVSAYDAEPVCGTDHFPKVLEVLAKHLGGPTYYISEYILEKTALPGFRPPGCGEPGINAHHRAMLAGLAVAGSKEER